MKGWSYGGFMTMWTVTQTNRFRAAVAGAGISNWLSYTGENGISEWMVPFFGRDGVRGQGGLRAELADQLHRQCTDTDVDHCW